MVLLTSELKRDLATEKWLGDSAYHTHFTDPNRIYQTTYVSTESLGKWVAHSAKPELTFSTLEPWQIGACIT